MSLRCVLVVKPIGADLFANREQTLYLPLVLRLNRKETSDNFKKLNGSAKGILRLSEQERSYAIHTL